MNSRSQWLRGLRRGSSAAGLLRLWVTIPLGHGCLSVMSVMFCRVEVCETSWSLFQKSPTDCGVSLCVIKKPRGWGGLDPLGAVAPKTNKQVMKKPPTFTNLTLNYLIHESSLSPKHIVTIQNKRILPNRKRKREISVELWSRLHRIYLNCGV